MAVKAKRPYSAGLRQEQANTTRLRIIETARRLLVAGTYSEVTMGEIAREAGVAYQTLYAIFGTKLRLAQAMVDQGFPHVVEAAKQFDEARGSLDAEIWLRVTARVFRRIFEPCADLVRFMLESGDPALQQRHMQSEESRLRRLREVTDALVQGGRLRSGIAAADALDVMWVMTGPECYWKFVFQRGWTPDRFEQWLADSLIRVLLAERR
jgi:AcrR family transcriptional regulator